MSRGDCSVRICWELWQLALCGVLVHLHPKTAAHCLLLMIQEGRKEGVIRKDLKCSHWACGLVFQARTPALYPPLPGVLADCPVADSSGSKGQNAGHCFRGSRFPYLCSPKILASFTVKLNVLNWIKIECLKISPNAAAEYGNTCIDVDINGQLLGIWWILNGTTCKCGLYPPFPGLHLLQISF